MWWKEYYIERFKEVVVVFKRVCVMIVVIDDGEVDMVFVREYGVEILNSICYNFGGKRYNMDRESEEMKFFYDVVKIMEEVMKCENVEKVIVVGFGFVKEDFYKFLKEKYLELVKKVVIEDISVIGRMGIYEVIKCGVVDRVY